MKQQTAYLVLDDNHPLKKRDILVSDKLTLEVVRTYKNKWRKFLFKWGLSAHGPNEIKVKILEQKDDIIDLLINQHSN